MSSEQLVMPATAIPCRLSRALPVFCKSQSEKKPPVRLPKTPPTPASVVRTPEFKGDTSRVFCKNVGNHVRKKTIPAARKNCCPQSNARSTLVIIFDQSMGTRIWPDDSEA